MKKVLIKNVTMAITNDLRMRYGIGVSLNSIQGSQVRIAIKTNEVIKRQEFSDFMDQLVKELPISYFTMQETTLDQVFSKLIQKDKAQFVDFDISHMRAHGTVSGTNQLLNNNENSFSINSDHRPGSGKQRPSKLTASAKFGQ